MPDTGAPWNIPYVAPTDNPRVYPAADEAQALAIAAGLTSSALFRQVISTTKTTTFTEAVALNATSGDVTGLTVTITPESASNKVLIIASINCAAATSGLPYLILYRAGSIVSAAVGDALSTRPVVTSAAGGASGNLSQTVPLIFLDSPSTAAATTYSIRMRHGDTTTTRDVYVNRNQSDNDDPRGARSISTITAIEVAA